MSKKEPVKVNIEFKTIDNKFGKDQCCKCGSIGITTYHPTHVECRNVRVVGRVYIYKQTFQHSHLHLICSICAYEWSNLPLDVSKTWVKKEAE